MSLIVASDCLPDQLFRSLQHFAHNSVFKDVESPHDGVTYPDLCVDIPQWIHIAIRAEIANAMGIDYRDVNIHLQFMRLTTEATPKAPHGAHNDAIHGSHSAFFYINEKPDEVMAGTSLLSHKITGMTHQPRTVEEWDLWMRDTNDYDKWKIDEMSFWEPNRMAIYDADRMHRAEPPGGWGSNETDGRLVLITFFSC